MSIDKVWVLAETADGKPTSTTLELLTKARTMGPPPKRVAWGTDTAAVAAELGDYGATTVHDVGDIGDALPGAPVAAAVAALVEGGNRPDVILVPASYDGRDIAARLSVRLDVPVITNVVDLIAEGDDVRSQHGLFGGRPGGHRPLHRRASRGSSWCGPSPSRPSPAAAARPRWSRRPCPSWAPPTPPRSSPVTSRSAPDPSSTRPTWWCRAGGASAAPSTTP